MTSLADWAVLSRVARNRVVGAQEELYWPRSSLSEPLDQAAEFDLHRTKLDGTR